MAGNLAPDPGFAEKGSYDYGVKTGVNSSRRGRLRFEEGIATDTDIPNEFGKGVMQGYTTAPGRMNHNANVYEKPAEETMRERAHMGSAAWPEAPEFIGGFAHGAGHGAEQRFEQVVRDGHNQRRQNYARTND
ncbi:hypothetical protein ACFWAP_00670 [Streptomyces goshikiensis]|uniref:hypothetical protein n=1 Tax=Streptomyces goshikiensis TaxID=1942 RepID=UPI0036473AFC